MNRRTAVITAVAILAVATLTGCQPGQGGSSACMDAKIFWSTDDHKYHYGSTMGMIVPDECRPRAKSRFRTPVTRRRFR